jgi:hypothetical protein
MNNFNYENKLYLQGRRQRLRAQAMLFSDVKHIVLRLVQTFRKNTVRPSSRLKCVK